MFLPTTDEQKSQVNQQQEMVNTVLPVVQTLAKVAQDVANNPPSAPEMANSHSSLYPQWVQNKVNT